jgi:hypothetical protein
VDIFSDGSNRPPALIGPTHRYAGDGQVHAFPGLTQTRDQVISTSGLGTSRSIYVSGKTLEGYGHCWKGTDIGMAMNSSTSGTDNYAVQIGFVSTASIRKIVAQPSPETSFPRSAWDAVNELLYFHYWDGGARLVLMSWDPSSNSLHGPVVYSDAVGAGRGSGAGGIVETGSGGAWVVYSLAGMLVRKTIGDASTTGARLPASGIRTPTTINAFPNPFNTHVRIGIRGMACRKGAGTLAAIRIYDPRGNLVHTGLFRPGIENGYTVSAPALTSGTYVVKAVVGNQILTRRIILQR